MGFRKRLLATLPFFLFSVLLQSQKPDSLPTYVSYFAYSTDLSQVINELEESYGLEFSYASESIENIQVTADCKDMPLEEALKTIFESNNIAYRVIDGKILLKINEKENFDNEEAFILQGQVFDRQSGDPLDFVAISIPYTSIAATSDQEGIFKLEIPSESIQDTILFQLLGYETQKLIIEKGTKEMKIFRLHPSPIMIREVLVIHKRERLEVSIASQSTTLNNSSSLGMNDSPVGEDLMKSLQMLAGVSADDDVSADIKIRGSNSDETLVVLDGIPLYNSSHFYGIFSGINAAYIDKISLYKNAFPISYGGKTGGVVELLSSNDIHDKIVGELDMSNMASSAVLDIPLGTKSKVRLSGRTTISDLSNSSFFEFSNQDKVTDGLNNIDNLTRRILLNTDPKFNFQDWNAKWVIKPNDLHHFDFNFYHSSDDFDSSYSNSFSAQNGLILTQYAEAYINEESWNNLGFGANYEYSKNGFSIKSSAYFTRYKNDALIGLDILRTRTGQEDKKFAFANSQKNEVKDESFDLKVSKKLNNNTELSVGANIIRHSASFRFNEEFTSILEGDDTATEFSQYISYNQAFQNKFILDLGLRASYYSPMEKYYASPRIKLSYLANDHFSLKASYSKYDQFLRELSHENRLGQNIQFWVLSREEVLPVSSSVNFMVGTNFKLGGFDIDLEYFNKILDGVAEHALIRPGFSGETPPPGNREYQLFVGTGKSYGLDLMISKHTKSYQGWIAYTLSETTNSFDEIAHGIDFPSQNHRTHQLKFINEFELGPFTLGANYIFSSGKPYTDLARIMADADRTMIDPNDRIKFLPDYQRIDLSLKYGFKIGSTRAQAGVSLFNVLDNENVKYLQYIYSVPTNGGSGLINNILGTQTPLLSRTLNLNFKLNF